tara:strand:- start:345 stop:899 length:555 start_codon:yes stop_codon:yes gene_type:complete
MNIFEDFNLINFKNKKPPSDNSLMTFKEIKEIDNLYSNKKFVKYYDNISKVFKNIIQKFGKKFPDNFVVDLLKSTEESILKLKNYHNRIRPDKIAKNYNIDLDIVNLNSAKTPSYPSGHSAQAEFLGLVLSDMYPNLRSQIMKEANNISLSRNIGRLHYDSDSKNGKELGQAFYKHYKLKKHAI